MSRKPRTRFRNKRTLDPKGVREGNFAIINQMAIQPDGHMVTAKSLETRLREAIRDLRNSCPRETPFTLVAKFDSPIHVFSVVPATPQGALVANASDGPPAPETQSSLAETSRAEAEEIAAVARDISKSAIDTGNQLAAEAEKRRIPLDEADRRMAGSRDEGVSRATVGRSCGPSVEIQYPDDRRQIGGFKDVSATVHSDETYALKGCRLTVTKPGEMELSDGPMDEHLARLRKDWPNLTLLRCEKDSPFSNILLIAAKAGLRLDMTVCVTQKVAQNQLFFTPVSIQNHHRIFEELHDWLKFLEENLQFGEADELSRDARSPDAQTRGGQ